MSLQFQFSIPNTKLVDCVIKIDVDQGGMMVLKRTKTYIFNYLSIVSLTMKRWFFS